MSMTRYTHDGGGAAIASAAASLGYDLAAAERYDFSNVTAARDALGTAINEMIRLDEEEANSFWAELRATLTTWPWEREAERNRFNAAVNDIVTGIRGNFRTIDWVVEDARARAAHIPDELYSSARDWDAASNRVGSIRTDINGLKSLQGWSGESADGYQASNTVQGNATEELTGVTQSVANTLVSLANFNCAIFQNAASYLGTTTQTVQATRSLRGGNGQYYIRSATFQSAISNCALSIVRVMAQDSIAGPAQTLADALNKALQSPALLAPGTPWPSGGAKADVPPAGVPTVTNPDLPENYGPGGMCLAPDEGVHK